MHARTVKLSKVAPCFLAIIIDSLGFGLVYPILTAIFSQDYSILSAETSSSLRDFYLGLGYLLYPLGMFFGASFLGDLSDRLGRKNVLLSCMLGLFISFSFLGLGCTFSSLIFLFSGRLLSGIMAGSQPLAQAAISDLSPPDHKAHNMALVTITISIGIIFGPLFGGFLSNPNIVSWFTYSTPFYGAALLSIIAFIWIFLSFEETYITKSHHPFKFSRSIIIFVDAFKDKSVKRVSFSFFLMQLGFSIYMPIMLVVMSEEFHYNSFQLGVFNGIMGVGFVVGMTMVYKQLLKIWSVYKIGIVSLIMTGIIVCITPLIYSEYPIIAFSFLGYMFDMIAYTALLTTFSFSVSKNAQGWAFNC